MRVGGLDLARRSDFSALVTLDARPTGATVTQALRLPQTAYRAQLALVMPSFANLDRLVFDASGVGDGVAELLPLEAIPVLIVSGAAGPVLRSGRVSVGKTWLISSLAALAGSGRLVIAQDCPGTDALRRELEAFAATPTRRGVKLAARGRAHDDLVMALGLAVLGARQSGLKTWLPPGE